jgi:serine/threonine-protein kinase
VDAEDRRTAEVDALRAEGRLAEAAALAAEAGDPARASALLEEACDFAGAARAAMEAGDPRRALSLAAVGGDELAAERAWKALAEGPREAAVRAAGDLAARGFGRHAGELYARIGEPLEAARAFAAAGEAARAATCFERAGSPADAARALEAGLRLRPKEDALRLALGKLLARHGRTEAAVKALQLIAPDAPEHALALPLLARSLDELGFDEAARDVRAELTRLGLDDEAPVSRASVPPTSRRASRAPGAGALLFGRYEVAREVAVTPHARVVEAVDRITGERVAVKLFAGTTEGAGRDAMLRFEREARALAQLHHANVVPFTAYHPDGPALVVAWMPGGSLADFLRREQVAPARAAEIAAGLLGALGEAHRLGILHRDVKPSNVLFDEIGAVRLSDFGAAHLGDLSSTATAGAIGTFAYMSPEQRLGRPATVASDLYGVGAVLAELLTGEAAEPAHQGKLACAPSSKNPDLGSAHDAVVAKLLDEDPRRRFADAFEARHALEAVAWPERLPPVDLRRRASVRPPERAKGPLDRLTSPRDVGDGRDASRLRHDAWLEREVVVIALDDASLEQARAFARAGHPALPTVLRVDTELEAIWIAEPRGRALADEPRPISPGQLARLRDAIDALHAAGGAHGFIDAEHLYLHDGEVTLAFPRSPTPDDAAERDRTALAALA